MITVLHKKIPPSPQPLFYQDKIMALWDHFIYFNQVKTAM